MGAGTAVEFADGGLTMDEVKRIDELLRETYDGNPWHGSSLKEILSGVTAHTAAVRGIASGHTIWEIVLHIEAWMEIVRLRLGGQVFEATPEQDWPAVRETADDAWSRAIEHLDAAYRHLREAVSQLTVDKLSETAAGKDYDVYTMLHGAINHNVYHSAQISVLRKGIASRA